MILYITIFLIILISLLTYVYFKQCYMYWKRRGLLTYPDAKFPLGHFPNPFGEQTTNLGIKFDNFYQYFKDKQAKHAGLYMVTTPIYMPIDLDVIKDVMTKHFDHFDAKGMFYNEKQQPVSAHLFQIGGERWKRLRMKVSPTFTSGKMKMMFPMVVKCTEPLLKSMENEDVLNIKDICAKFTMHVIGSCAFGIECASFQNSEFFYYGTKIFAIDTFRAISRNIQFFCPKIAALLGLLPFPRDCSDFFVKMITETVKMREENGIHRNDFIQLLIELKNKPNPEDAISMNEVLSEGWLFFNAGFETSSTTMSFCLFQLAKYENYQDKAREECRRIYKKYNGKWCYEAIREMKYIQQVINETLRIFPPVTILNRECTDDFQVDNVVIPNGTKVFIPVYSIHMDSEFYPNPEVFDPERFTEEAKQKRHPYSHLPFGEGPRICLGMRFAMMQMKIGICQLLLHYKFSVHPNVPQPFTFNQGFILSTNETLKLHRRKI